MESWDAQLLAVYLVNQSDNICHQFVTFEEQDKDYSSVFLVIHHDLQLSHKAAKHKFENRTCVISGSALKLDESVKIDQQVIVIE